jgi:GAF domain-containing protein
MELIKKVSEVLMQSSDIDEILEKMLDYITALLERVDRGVIILFDPETRKILKPVSWINKDTEALPIEAYSRSIVDRVLREGKPVIMSDTFSEEEADRSVSMELMRVRSVMCVPLISRSQIRGAIYVDSVNKPRGFRSDDLSLLTALSSSAAIAIDNALLYAREKTETLQ